MAHAETTADDAADEKRTALILAQFETPADLIHACEKVRDAGYKKWDAHTPFPVHGMDRAMGLKDSKLGWIVLAFALTGLTGAFVMMHWMNGVDYRLVVGGKPPGAPGTLPSMVPVMFELTILLSAFGALLGMLHLNKLPRHHHSVFYSDRFREATDDKFFISIEAEDPKFNLKKTRELLEAAHATHVEIVEEDNDK